MKTERFVNVSTLSITQTKGKIKHGEKKRRNLTKKSRGYAPSDGNVRKMQIGVEKFKKMCYNRERIKTKGEV